MSTEQPPVVAVFSPASGRREPLDLGIASRRTGAPLVVAVVRKGNALAGAVEDAPDAPRVLEHLREDLRRRRVAADVRIFEARTEEKALEQLRPRLIVLEPRHRRALGAAILGTTLERIIHASACPVAVVSDGYKPPEGGMRVLGVAFAPTAEGREALRAAPSSSAASLATWPSGPPARC